MPAFPLDSEDPAEWCMHPSAAFRGDRLEIWSGSAGVSCSLAGGTVEVQLQCKLCGLL